MEEKPKKSCCKCSSNFSCLEDNEEDETREPDEECTGKEENVDGNPEVGDDNNNLDTTEPNELCTCKQEHADDKPDGTCTCSPSCRFLNTEKSPQNEQTSEFRSCTCKDREPEEESEESESCDEIVEEAEPKCTCTPRCPFKELIETRDGDDAEKTEPLQTGADKGCTCKLDTSEGECVCSPSCRFLDAAKSGQDAAKGGQNASEASAEPRSCTCPPPEEEDKEEENIETQADEDTDSVCVCPSLGTTDHTKWDCRKSG